MDQNFTVVQSETSFKSTKMVVNNVPCAKLIKKCKILLIGGHFLGMTIIV